MDRILLNKSLLALCVLLSTVAASSDLKYMLVGRGTVLARLQDAPQKNSDRVKELAKMFREAGCRPTEEPVKGLHEPNILCLLPGASESMIVVGGHLDHVDEGTGVVDDWSGASMLPSLYQSLSGQPRTHTFLFIGFSGEEEGMVGSEFYVKQLTAEQRKNIATMVNLECLGISSTEVWTSHSEPVLIRMLVAMAQSLKVPLGGVNVEQVGTTDSESFAKYKIPRITITAITQDTLPLLHSSKDNIKAVNEDWYYDSYRLVAPYLVLLDQQVPTDGSPIDKRK